MIQNAGMFDYQTVADELNIDPKVTEKIIHDTRKEFPNDDMLFELHVLRALKALQHKKYIEV